MNHPKRGLYRFLRTMGFILISAIWSSVNFVRRKINPQKKRLDLGVPVLSVGNLEAGGTGKTPMTLIIAKEAQNLGLKVCILTRGYRSKMQNLGGMISPGNEKLDPQIWGDESVLLHQQCPEAWIGVGAQREKIWSRFRPPVDLVILEDGFQNFKIKADFQLVLVTEHCNRFGLLRDFCGQAQFADACIWTKGAQEPQVWSEFMGPKSRAKFILNKEIINRIAEKKVFLICGIAAPHFLKQELDHYCKVVKSVFLNDHAHFTQKQILTWQNQAKSLDAILVMTAKDAVKWKSWVPDLEQQNGVVLEGEFAVTGLKPWTPFLESCREKSFKKP